MRAILLASATATTLNGLRREPGATDRPSSTSGHLHVEPPSLAEPIKPSPALPRPQLGQRQWRYPRPCPSGKVGSVNENRAPLPRLATLMRPPWASMIE